MAKLCCKFSTKDGNPSRMATPVTRCTDCGAWRAAVAALSNLLGDGPGTTTEPHATAVSALAPKPLAHSNESTPNPPTATAEATRGNVAENTGPAQTPTASIVNATITGPDLYSDNAIAYSRESRVKNVADEPQPPGARHPARGGPRPGVIYCYRIGVIRSRDLGVVSGFPEPAPCQH